MKVALIGNMNNNHFSLMRYFRNVGVDAYLLLYKEDGKGENSHFVPENDTFYIDKWKDYIIQTELSNGGIGTFKHLLFPKYVKHIFDSYDYIIGNGFAPGYANIVNRKLDMFLPYADSIEFLHLNKSKNIKQYIYNLIMKRLQLAGIKNQVKNIITYDQSALNIINRFNIKTPVLSLPIPMVYNLESPPKKLPQNIKNIVKKMDECEMVVFSHVSHIWKNLPLNSTDVKKNDILIKGFAKYINESKNKEAMLFLLEYGIDVNETKKLIKELKIEEYVVWLPKMPRKEILFLLEKVDIGAGEFGGVLWGGTGWEFLFKGVPFLQYVNTTKEKFKEYTNTEMPPIFNVRTENEIASVLLKCETDKKTLKKMKKDCVNWYNKNVGEELISKYISILKEKGK